MWMKVVIKELQKRYENKYPAWRIKTKMFNVYELAVVAMKADVECRITVQTFERYIKLKIYR